VVTTYDKPFTAKDHNAISRNMVVASVRGLLLDADDARVLGVLVLGVDDLAVLDLPDQDGKIVYAKDEDAKNAGVVRVKEKASN
jgi:branched-chain amino acid transport system substrate-binding protein